MSESLRNDGRIWVPEISGDSRAPSDIPENERDYYLERRYPAFGNLVPRDVASRAAKKVCDEGRGVGKTGLGVYLDFEDAIGRIGEQGVKDRYGNLFHMYQKITAENPYKVPMRIYPAVHYTMGGLWVDYNLMTSIDGCYSIGESNFSDHGSNRLGASALMQGLADGYFILPYTNGDFLAQSGNNNLDSDSSAFKDASRQAQSKIDVLLNTGGDKTPDHYHRELGKIMWEDCGMARSKESLSDALEKIPVLQEEFKQNVKVTGTGTQLNQTLERAGRIADFFEFSQLLVRDALTREESCGGHFRVESQTDDGEALRNDEKFSHVAVWEHKDDGQAVRHEEPLAFEYCKPSQRSYK
jgi:succinate dehydrogenase / fumarate reductase flavoprotein subunit